MSIPTPTLRLTLDGEPCSIRISSASLAELEGARRAKAEERLRAEGFAEAQATAAGAMERAAAALDEERGGLIGSVAENAALLAVEIAQQLLRSAMFRALELPAQDRHSAAQPDKDLVQRPLLMRGVDLK